MFYTQHSSFAQYHDNIALKICQQTIVQPGDFTAV